VLPMKIICHDPSGTFADISLGTDGASGGSDVFLDPPPLPREKRQTQITDIAFGNVPFVANRGNRRVSLTWTVERVHASQDAAQAFMTTHADNVPYGVTVTIKFYTDDGTEKDYAGGSVTQVDCVGWQNMTTRFRYAVEGLTPP
jgi:hypothetical protein